MTTKQIPIVAVYGKRIIEVVYHCLAKMNNGHRTVNLRGYGGNVPRAIEVAQILRETFEVEVSNETLGKCQFYRKDLEIPSISIILKWRRPKVKTPAPVHAGWRFIQFGVYQLLFDWLLSTGGKLGFYAADPRRNGGKKVKVLSIEKKGGQYKIVNHKIAGLHNVRNNYYSSSGQRSRQDEIELRRARHIGSKTNDALVRSGLVMPENWMQIADRLSQHDDVVLGLDTNVITKCTVTEHILPAISLVEKDSYIHTPNWLLFMVPAIALYEVEFAAGNRERGKLTSLGRMGYRGLQEILQIRRNIDVPGITLLTPPADNFESMAVELDMSKRLEYMVNQQESGKKLKCGGQDMALRNQIRKFIKDLHFNKGTYFLTADKTAAALSQIEGLNPIYVKYGKPLGEIIVNSQSEKPAIGRTRSVPIASLIYELAITFDQLVIEGSIGSKRVQMELNCDTRTDSLSNWVHKKLLCRGTELKSLIALYDGNINLAEANMKYNALATRFESNEWLEPPMQDEHFES